eukprot:PhM_4_TR3142/c0_g1_i1/m.70136
MNHSPLFTFFVVSAVLAISVSAIAETGQGNVITSFEGNMKCPVCRLLCTAMSHQARENMPEPDLMPEDYVAFMASPDRIKKIVSQTTSAVAGMCVLKALDEYKFVDCSAAKFRLPDGGEVALEPPRGMLSHVVDMLNTHQDAVKEYLSQEYSKAEMEWDLCVQKLKVCDSRSGDDEAENSEI